MKPRTKYLAIMFFTGDSDTRVDPLIARKMAALMQASSGGETSMISGYFSTTVGSLLRTLRLMVLNGCPNTY